METKEESDLEVYNAYMVLIKNNKANPEIGKAFVDLRQELINDRLNYLKSQPHLKDCDITLEETHKHPIIRIDRPTGYDYSFVFEEEVHKDKDWVGNCSSCCKPIFKGDSGHLEPSEMNRYNLTWRGCLECSERNGYLIKVF